MLIVLIRMVVRGAAVTRLLSVLTLFVRTLLAQCAAMARWDRSFLGQRRSAVSGIAATSCSMVGALDRDRGHQPWTA